MELSVYSPVLVRNMYAEPEEAIKHARSLGITAVEVFGNELEKIALAEYQKYYSEYGIKINGIVQGAYLSDPDADVRISEIDRVKKVVDLAAEYDVKHIMVAPQLRRRGDVTQVQTMEDKMFVRDTIVNGMNEIVSYAKNSGVTLTLENFSTHTHPFSTVSEMRYMLEHIPGLKYTLDAGNFYCVKEDVLGAYQQLKGYLYNMHIKDWVLDEFGYLIRPELPALNGCVMGEGILPLAELLSVIKQDGFSGEMLLEVNTVVITKQILEASVNFVNRGMGK